jgi:methanogenic corrinoid protein MtbC1
MLRNGHNARDRASDRFSEPGSSEQRAGSESADPFSIQRLEQDVRGGASQQSMAMLIADEIIPRLIAAHRISEPVLRLVETMPEVIVALDPERLADESVNIDTSRLLELAQAALSAGLSFEALMIDVMAPAARILGERWETDKADFVEVTLGLWRLQELVHLLAVGHQLPAHSYDALPDRRVLCAVAPGDDHYFGSVMLEEMFRRAGWSARGARNLRLEDLLAEVRLGSFDLIALTVSVETNSAAIADMVSALRSASRNPGVSIMVGGPVFNQKPGLADEVGADATASDGRAALQKAEMLVGQLQGRRSSGARPDKAGRQPPRPGLQPG